jgi:hypothetical protein
MLYLNIYIYVQHIDILILILNIFVHCPSMAGSEKYINDSWWPDLAGVLCGLLGDGAVRLVAVDGGKGDLYGRDAGHLRLFHCHL